MPMIAMDSKSTDQHENIVHIQFLVTIPKILNKKKLLQLGYTYLLLITFYLFRRQSY